MVSILLSVSRPHYSSVSLNGHLYKTDTHSKSLAFYFSFICLSDGHLYEKDTNSAAASAGPYAFRVTWFKRVFPTVSLG